MQSIQQRLWPDPQPLVERLGREFFRKVPETPGVYLMRGRADTVLYVGKAKNLRHRLCSYRVANPERLPRRILRLIHLIESIVWEQCGDELAALRRESELLLALKPRFNRAGVWQGPKRFLLWRLQSSGLQLVVSETPVEGWSGVGPSGPQMIQLHRSLVRLLWRQLQPDRGLSGMPPGWFNGQHGPCVLIPQSDPGLASEVFAFLELLAQGDSESFGQWMLAAKNRFEQGVRDEDLTVVTEHFGAPLLTAFPCPRTT